jgi:CheY-like chemotaxis protein
MTNQARPPVLVVHPDAAFAEAVVRALWARGLSAVSVESGERAIDRFVVSAAAALVVSSDLPGRDGAATVESIRWAPGGADVPVVLTARNADPRALSETGRRLRAATLTGADADDAEAVAALVGRVIETDGAVDERTSNAGPSPGPAVTHSSPTISALVEPHRRPQLPPTGSPPAETSGFPAHRARTAPHPPSPTVAARRPREGADAPSKEPPDADSAARYEAEEVERRARDVTARTASTVGDLAHTPFPRLLVELAEARATGALVVVAPPDDRLRTTVGDTAKKVVYFRGGVPVYVKSNLLRECLGQILVQMGLIDASVRNASLERMRETGARQGAALLAMGAITPDDLRAALEEQLRTKLFDLFAWTAGEYRFSTRILPPPEVVTLELGLEQIVFEGVVRRIPPRRLFELLAPHVDHYVVPVAQGLTRFFRLDLVNEARLVLRALDGTRTLRELMSVAGQRPGAAAQLVYAMHCLGALRFSEAMAPADAMTAPAEPPSPALRGPLEVTPLLTAIEVGDRWDDQTEDGTLPPVAEAFAAATRDTRLPVHRQEPEPGTPPIPRSDGPFSPVPRAVVDEPSAGDTPVWVDARASVDVPVAPRATGDPPTAPGGPDLDARLQRLAEAERVFRRGERALSRGKLDDALACFRRATELVPSAGEFLARRAYTELLVAPPSDETQRRLLGELEEATRLSPKAYVTHLLLGDARRATGDPDGARVAYEQALAANPQCVEALEALRAL